MNIKVVKPQIVGNILIVGNNYITSNLYLDIKRYLTILPHKINNIKENKNNISYIIDCSFNEKSQNDVIEYSKSKNIKKVIILNRIKKKYDIEVIQLIVSDIYNNNHHSFTRPGFGNSDDSDIKNGDFICESIRRIHEAKLNFVPNVYLNYSEDIIKYLHISNLHKIVEYTLIHIKNGMVYEIYDEYKNATTIINTIKEIVDYNGNIIFNNIGFDKVEMSILPFKYNYKSIENNIKEIYKYNLYNNGRFSI